MAPERASSLHHPTASSAVSFPSMQWMFLHSQTDWLLLRQRRRQREEKLKCTIGPMCRRDLRRCPEKMKRLEKSRKIKNNIWGKKTRLNNKQNGPQKRTRRWLGHRHWDTKSSRTQQEKKKNTLVKLSQPAYVMSREAEICTHTFSLFHLQIRYNVTSETIRSF